MYPVYKLFSLYTFNEPEKKLDKNKKYFQNIF